MPRLALIFAWLALVWERSARVLWPGLAWLALFATLSLFGLWERFGDPTRAIFGLATLAAAVWLTLRGVRSFSWPGGDDAARRVEEDSHIAARPHEAMRDRPSDSDPVARSVWREHRRRMQARLADARARRPKGAWAEMDALALRGVAVIALVAAWAFAGPAARDRLSEAFGAAPILAGGADATLDAWIDPPAYTGRAPVFLAEDDDRAEAPEGAVFVARIAGARRAPRLVARGEDGTERAEPRRIGDGVWEARIALTSTSDVSLQSGGARRHWRVEIRPDAAPTARILAVPEGSANGELELIFATDDDYGVVSQAVEFRRETGEGEWERIEINAATAAERDGQPGRRALIDTAQHRLAGERVELRVVAIDAAGNEGRSPTIGVTLPERVFLDALARAVAEQRRAVLEHRGSYAPLEEPPVLTADTMPPGPPIMSDRPDRRIERAPDGMQTVALALTAITDAPEYFFDDGVVYLGLRSVLHRLRRARHDDDLGAIEADLWQIALRAELGSLADAEAQLRAAERALMEALARGADETELNALFEAYQQAMENYLAALAREALEENRMAEGGGQQGMQLDNQSIQDMLDALREAAELGDTANARQALQQLTELLRNLQMNLAAGEGGQPQDDPISEAIRRALEELSDVIGEQRDLQDQTFNLDQQGGQPGDQQDGQQGNQPGQPQTGGEGQPGSSGPQSLAENQNGSSRAGQLAEEQGALAQALGEALEQLRQGGSPDGTEGFGGAEQAMRDAERALRAGDPESALEAQGEALAGLRDGAEQLARELMERMQEQQSAEAGEGEGERDPLGRPAEGAMSDGSGVDVPDEMDRARAREILEELRRRAAEAGRSQDELDYIERLLDRF